MSNSVQNRLSNCVFVECRNVTREEPFAKLLSRVANVNDRPKFFEEEKQPCPEITPVLIVDTILGVAPFEHDLRLRQQSGDRVRIAEKNHRRIRYASIDDQSCVGQQMQSVELLQRLIATPANPGSAEPL